MFYRCNTTDTHQDKSPFDLNVNVKVRENENEVHGSSRSVPLSPTLRHFAADAGLGIDVGVGLAPGTGF